MDAHTLTVDDMKNLRVGRSLGFTLYAQFGEAPTKKDVYLGVFNNPLLADHAVQAVNRGHVAVPMPWIAIGRLIYPSPDVDRLDDFIAVMLTPAIARWIAGVVASLNPPTEVTPS